MKRSCVEWDLFASGVNQMSVHKVLFTASSYSHIFHFHIPYLQAFKERGWTVQVACGGAEMPVDGAEMVFHIPFEKKMSSGKNFRAANELRAIIKRERYDLVCTHTSLAAFFTRLALWGMRDRPCVVNVVHGYLFDDRTSWLKRNVLLTAERMTARETDLLLAMNEWDLRTAQRYRLGQRVAFIPGIGVDFSRFEHDGTTEASSLRGSLGIAEEAFVLMYAAEFSTRKSQETIIRAMTRLPENAVLILAGDGDKRKECEDLAEHLGLRGRVYFPGYVSDIPSWYRNADAVVSSSRSEGLPFNVMEAMYLGKPVVASAVKGHEDLVCHEVSGLLFPYGDADACAQQIQRLLESPELARRLGENGKKNVAQYGLDEVLPAVMSEYETLIAARSGAAV